MKNSKRHSIINNNMFYENAIRIMLIIIAVLIIILIGSLTALIFVSCTNEEDPMATITTTVGTNLLETKSPESHTYVMSIPETEAPVTTIHSAEAPDVTTVPETQIPEVTTMPKETGSTYFNVTDITIYDVYLPATHIYSRWYSDYDFEAEQLDYLYNLCREYDINIKFVLGIIATESGFRSQVKNKYSSATGYGQVTQGTAEWVYENLLKRGDYDTSRHVELMRDWKLNMDIMMRLIKWLNDRYGTYQKTAMYYHGSTSYDSNVEYANKVSSKLTELFGITMADIER